MALYVINPYIDLFTEIVRKEPPYAFGEDENLYERIMELGLSIWSQASYMRFPEDIIFVDRTLAGHFGNLVRLGASGPWRSLLERFAHAALAGA